MGLNLNKWKQELARTRDAEKMLEALRILLDLYMHPL